MAFFEFRWRLRLLLVLGLVWIGGMAAMGQTPTPTQTPGPDLSGLDLNRDGAIDAKDLLSFLRGWDVRGLITPTPTPPFTFVQGFVREASSATALSGARVMAGTSAVFSQSDGFYQIPQVRTDATQIEAELSGYVSLASPAEFTPPFRRLDLELVPLTTPTPTVAPSPTATPIDRIAYEVPGTKRLAFRRIPSGSFLMGSDPSEVGRFADEGPVHGVVIPEDFYLSETEVTQAQWRSVMGSMPEGFPESGPGIGDDFPIVMVSYEDIAGLGGFLERLSLTEAGNFRLPSEAEWEYACRAGTQTRFFYGNALGCDDTCEDCTAEVSGGVARDYMVYCDLEGQALEVASRLPSPFGLRDMHGNVFEWCEDWYHATYSGAPSDGSAWLVPVGTGRVIRGGDWFAPPALCRSAFRGLAEPTLRLDNLGFRVVLEP